MLNHNLKTVSQSRVVLIDEITLSKNDGVVFEKDVVIIGVDSELKLSLNENGFLEAIIFKFFFTLIN